jgi:signal transduction histidine kinase/DNA-binding response OmpR family regulator
MTATPLRVLLIEDSQADAELVLADLRRGGFAPRAQRVETEASLRQALASQVWDCILSDYELPRFSGLAALRLVHELLDDIPFIVVSGAIGEDTAVAVMRAGANDYVMKGSLARLCPAIARELRDAVVRRERRHAAAALAEDGAVAGALNQVGRHLIASVAVPSLLSALCDVTARVLQCDSSHTLLWDEDGEVFRPIATYGASSEAQAGVRAMAVPRMMLSDVLTALEHDEVVQCTPTAADLLCTPSRDAAHQLCIALRRGPAPIGILVASRRDPSRPFGTTDTRIARGIAQIASLTLEHARVRQQLEQASRLKSDFVATMSHELRTPLHIILGYADLLRAGEFGPLTDPQQDIMCRIESSGGDLLELVNATLDLSRLERGMAPVDIEPIALGEWLRELVDNESAHGCRAHVDVRLDLAADLPTIYCDRVKLKVVVRNVLRNAFKFTHDGQVRVRVRRQADSVEICVTDTGCGIDAHFLPVIFEPFRQAGEVLTGHVPGVGLGLYIVRKQLDLLHGDIDVESTPGIGSTFRIVIPCDLRSRAPTPPHAEAFRSAPAVTR